MSLAHIRLLKISETNEVAVYKAESFDLSDEGNWDEVGVLQINKHKKNFEFKLSSLAQKVKFMPPEIYDLPGEERENMVKEKYKDYGWGAWSMRIHAWTKLFLERSSYPSFYPEHFFKESS